MYGAITTKDIGQDKDILQAVKDFGNANAEIKKRHKYHCGMESLRPATYGYSSFFLSPDGQNGELYSELIKMKYRSAGFNAPYFWKVRKGQVFITYTEGDVSIYKRELSTNEVKEDEVIECPDCDGTGTVVCSTPAHQAYTEERGTYIVDEEQREEQCERCEGSGEVERDI